MGKLNGTWRLKVHHRYQPLIKALRKAGDKSASYKVPLRRFAVQYAQEIDQRFNKSKGGDGKKWPEWSEDYARRTESRALGVLSGEMKQTLTNAASAIIRLGDFKLVYGMRNAPYAVAFNFGREKRKGKGKGEIPQRDVMGWNKEMRIEVETLLARHQKEILTRALKQFGISHGG